MSGDPSTFEQILERLESITEQLEHGDVPLEQSLALFEEGIRLSREGTLRLNQAEHKVELLMQGGQARPLDVDDAKADAE